jgi:hypothetical protein
MTKLLPSSTSAIIKSQKSAVINSKKLFNIKSKTTLLDGFADQKVGSFNGSLSHIEKKIIIVDKLLKESLFLSRKEDQSKRKGKEQEKFSSKEKELETKKPPTVKGIKLPSLPKMGFFGWIKNFITQTILGFFAVRLIEFLPQLLKILPVIIKVSDFIVNVGGKLLDGLITFVDWGYKAYDTTRGFVKNTFGENGAKQFDHLSSLLNKFLNLAIIAGMVASGSGRFSSGKGPTPSTRPRPGTGGRPRVTTSGGGRAGGFDLRNPFRQRPTITTSAGKKGLLSSIRPLLKRIPLPVIGALIDFGLSVALGENPGRAAFRAIGAGLLGAVGVAAGSVIPVAGNFIGGLLGGAAGDAIGGALYDAFFGSGVKPNKGKTVKAAGGGRPSTKSGRTIKKKRKSRTLSFTPRRIRPGANAGGEDKVQSIFPNPSKPGGMFGFLGGLFGENKQEEPQKPKEKTANPQEFLVKSNDVLGKSDFFGPFFTLAIKTVLGQKPDILDYRNAGRGLNAWMQTTFKSSSIGFAGGGEVDIKQLFSGEDLSDAIAKSVEDSVSKEVDMTIRDLAKEISLRPVGREEMIRENIKKGTEAGATGGGGGGEVGGTTGVGTVEQRAMLDAISFAEGTKASYGTVFGGKVIPELARGEMTVSQVLEMQRTGRFNGIQYIPPNSYDSDATGRYQFMSYTLKEEIGKQGVKMDDKFTPSLQDKLILGRITRMRGVTAELLKKEGMSAAVMDRLAPEFASFPYSPKGNRSYYGQPVKSPESIRNAYNKALGIQRELASTQSEKGGGTLGSKKGNLDEAQRIAQSMGLTMTSGTRGPRYPGDRSLHIQGRARDFSNDSVGRGTPQQLAYAKKMVNEFGSSLTQLIYTPLGYGIANGKKVPLSYWGESTNRGHYNHVHVAYEKGGETLDGPHTALIGEKGKEYVIDADSYEETERVAPGLLDILNYNVHDKTSLQKNMPAIIGSLSQYADYEMTYSEPEVAFIPIPLQDSVGDYGTTSRPSVSYDSISSIDSISSQISDSLMYG